MTTNQDKATAAHDRAVAANERRAALDPDLRDVPEGASRWSAWIDLDHALAGEPPPQPQVCRWDGSALFYPNEVHSVFGDPESMKSWLMLLACAQQLKAGCRAFYLDMESIEQAVVERLLLLGVERDVIKRCFHYFRPDGPITNHDQYRWQVLVRKFKPTLVVLDGVTEAFATQGLSIMDPVETARWFRRFSRQFQVEPTDTYPGPAIVELDHVVKDRDSRNGWAIGSIHKKAGIKGAAYSLEPVKQFGKGKHGISRRRAIPSAPAPRHTARSPDRRPDRA